MPGPDNAAHACIAAKRFFIHADIHDAFVQGFRQRFSALKLGDPMEEGTDIGPLATATIRDDLAEQVSTSVKGGAHLFESGHALPDKGYWFDPVILSDAPDDTPSSCDEMFGPAANLWTVGSLDDAEALAKALGIQYDVVPIEPVFEQLKTQLTDIFAGCDEDTAEENMQARIRGNILMSMSNKFGSLLLTTGNKSELAVGYCTLYGDMCGGLAVISDLPKLRVYSLAKWINRDREIIPDSTITKPPSAELRPDQVDQDSLPEYNVLDAILEAYVVDGQDAESIIASGHDADTVQRIIRLININEYKRRQAAPGIKVTSKAFGVGRRIPVAKRFM